MGPTTVGEATRVGTMLCRTELCTEQSTWKQSLRSLLSSNLLLSLHTETEQVWVSYSHDDLGNKLQIIQKILLLRLRQT